MYYDERENTFNYSDIDKESVSVDNEYNYVDMDNTVKKFDNDFKVDTINVNVNNFRKDNSLYSLSESLNKGNSFKNEYIPYKNYIYKVVVKGEKDSLLLKIQELTFRVIDLNLYLDIYPNDLEVFKIFKKKLMKRNMVHFV